MPPEDGICPVDPGEEPMPFPEFSEAGNIGVAHSALAQGFAAAATRRNDSADQLASDSQRMWSIAMTSPTVMAAHGMRVAAESGGGRTRAETNNPGNTAAPGGGAA